MITTMIFLGILGTFAIAESPLRIIECLNVPVKENFEPEKFFKGNWFLTNIRRAPEESEVTNICQESKSKILEGGIVNHIIFSESDVLRSMPLASPPEAAKKSILLENVSNKSDKIYIFAMSIPALKKIWSSIPRKSLIFFLSKLKPPFIQTNCTGNVKNKQEKVVFQCKKIRAEKNKNFQLEGTVVETDYEHFAIFYVCGKDGDKVTGEDFLVLNRKEDGEPTDPRIVETLKKYGLVLDELLSRKKVHCKNHPDF